uniref:V-type proton ATPase subunit a n=1 Tax=Globodera pallida TaxID=36090 RepID=A0A183BIT8_GLOPA
MPRQGSLVKRYQHINQDSKSSCTPSNDDDDLLFCPQHFGVFLQTVQVIYANDVIPRCSVWISVFVDPSIGSCGTDLVLFGTVFILLIGSSGIFHGFDVFVESTKKTGFNHGFGHPISFSLIPFSAIVVGDNSLQTFLPAPMIEDYGLVKRIQCSAHQWDELGQLFQQCEEHKAAIDDMLKNCVINLRMGQEAEEAEHSMEALELSVKQFVD